MAALLMKLASAVNSPKLRLGRALLLALPIVALAACQAAPVKPWNNAEKAAMYEVMGG